MYPQARTYTVLDGSCGVEEFVPYGSYTGDVGSEFSGTIQTGATGGTFHFQWAENTAGAGGGTTVTAGSYLTASLVSGGLTGNLFAQNGNSFGALALLGTNDYNNLGLETNGIQRMLLNTSGQVGIDTASPLASLDVRATSATTAVASISGSTNYAALVLNNSGKGDLFTASSSGLNRFVITQSGNVGIGTTMPQTGLDVQSSANFANDIFVNQNTGGLFLGPYNTYTTGIDRNASGDLNLVTNSSNSLTVLNSNGNVGIGNTAPGQALTVGASGQFTVTSGGAVNASPTTNGVTALTINGTTGTSAIAAVINQAKGSDILELNGTLTSSTITNGLLVNMNGSGGTMTNGIQIQQANGALTNGINMSGTMATGLNFSGTYNTNLINSTNFTVSPNGNIQLGANGGAPQAVTIGNAVATGTNVAGGNLTIAPSIGTGLGGSGSLIFSTAPTTTPILDYHTQDLDDSFTSGSQNDSWWANIGNNSNRILIVGVNDSGGLGTNNSVTDCPTNVAPCAAGGVALTRLTNKIIPSSHGELEFWYLVNPPVGNNYIQPHLNSTQDVQTVIADYYNVNTSSPFGTAVTNNGTGTSASSTITTSTGQLAIDLLGVYNFDTDVAGSGQTALWTETGGYTVGSYKLAGASSTTMSWTITSDTWAQIAVPLNSNLTTSSTDTLTQRMVILPNGNVGIGTATPSAEMTIYSNASAYNTAENGQSMLDLTNNINGQSLYMGVDGTTFSGFIGSSQNGLLDFLDLNPRGGNVGINNVEPSTTLDVTGLIRVENPQGETAAPTRSNNGEFAFANVGGNYRLYFRSNGSNEYINASGTGDYSEYFQKDDPSASFPTGYIMSISDGNVNAASSSSVPLGVISAYGTTGFDNSDGTRYNDHNYANVGLLGHLPIIVSSENGDINPGDFISAESQYPGIGTKDSSTPKTTVGVAIQSFTPSQWSCPTVSSLNDIVWPENIENYNQPDICYKLPNGIYVGRIMAEVSPSWHDPDMYLTSTGNVSLFENGTNPVTSQTIYGVNSNGQTDNGIGVYANAVIGNLTAGNINAENIDLGGQNIENSILSLQTEASHSANLNGTINDLSTQDLNLESSVNSLSDDLTQLQTEMASQEAQIQGLQNLVTLGAFTASSSSQLGLNQLSITDATASGSLTVLGQTLLNDVGITGTLTDGVMTITGLDNNGQASINTIGNLKLQDEGAGGIDILNGEISINTHGDIVSKGEITTTKLNISSPNVQSASLGEITIPAGQTQAVATTSALTPNSHIFVSSEQPIGIGVKAISNNTFLIQLQQNLSSDLRVTWWIIN